MIYHDMETGPMPESYLLETFRPVFEPNKTLKDPVKIEADLAAKRKAWLEDSALHAERGRVLCIGWKTKGSEVAIIDGNEAEILEEWITLAGLRKGTIMAGFNSLGFDWPFFRRRCILTGVSFPYYDRSEKWKPWTLSIYDALADWQSGDRHEYISLDALARALGVGRKGEGISAKFYELYSRDKSAALAHLTNDVLLTEAVCERLRA